MKEIRARKARENRLAQHDITISATTEESSANINEQEEEEEDIVQLEQDGDNDDISMEEATDKGINLKKDPVDSFINNTCFPSNKGEIVFFFMLVSLHRRYLTDEGLEAVMAFLNIVLTTVGDTNYRFPKCARTFTG
ncbi:hypothetical protein V8B55DRAFT_1433346 [Mucor lusitanicus]